MDLRPRQKTPESRFTVSLTSGKHARNDQAPHFERCERERSEGNPATVVLIALLMPSDDAVIVLIVDSGSLHLSKIEAMRFHTEYLTLHTKTKRAYVHLTPQVESALRKSEIKDGMILVSAMHITAGVYVNDNESGLIKDIDAWLETLAPFRQNYQHHQTGEDNGDAHLKSLIIHHEVIVPVTGGRLDFGPWQQIFYAEFDGQRDKRVLIKVMGE
jgi:secondary thiamine-phosphate synthase enzyme